MIKKSGLLLLLEVTVNLECSCAHLITWNMYKSTKFWKNQSAAYKEYLLALEPAG